MRVKITQADAFASEPFTGNPAAVCILDRSTESAWMQNVALEMNLSETGFLWREGAGYRLRWFTPATEVALCGHATLASAHVLWEEGHLRPDEHASFLTLSGPLSAEKRGDLIVLDFPATPVRAVEATPVVSTIAEALGCDPAFVGRSTFDYLVEVNDEDQLRGLAPDLARLASVETRGIIVTARGVDYDFVSRFFAPAVGLPEDSVTGSAHCALGPYWAAKLGKSELRAFQASKRGGSVHVTVAADRVNLGGTAVTTLRGELLVGSEGAETVSRRSGDSTELHDGRSSDEHEMTLARASEGDPCSYEDRVRGSDVGLMRIRTFEDHDEDAVVALWAACGLLRHWNDPRKDIARKRRVQRELFLVGTVDDKLVGSVMAGYDGHRGWVNYLAVAPQHRRNGFARSLMLQVEQRLRQLGCPKINLQIRRDNSSAITFYQRLGFAEDAAVSFGRRLERDDE